MDQPVHGVTGSIVPAPSGSGPSRFPGMMDGKERSMPFQEVLDNAFERQERLRFSLHAQERIRFRNIPMGVQEVERLKSGVDRVAEKGSRESLVLMDRSAFLVSVKNRTVITAMGGEDLRNNIFTNIDSAVVV